MLSLNHAYIGPGSAQPVVLSLANGRSVLLHPSADSVSVLSTPRLELLRVLSFGEIFPGVPFDGSAIHCVTVDPGMKLVIASIGHRCGAWALASDESTWRPHSSFILPEGDNITAMACTSGLLAFGTLHTLSIYTLVMDDGLLTWSQKWSRKHDAATTPSIIRFSPSLAYIATTAKEDHIVRIYSTPSGRLSQRIPHARRCTDIGWRNTDTGSGSRDTPVMYTHTVSGGSGVLRIFIPVIDSPGLLQLSGALDVPFSPSASASTTSSMIWIDRSAVRDSLLISIRDNKDTTSAKVAQEMLDSSWDLFMRIYADGSVTVVAVAHIDGRPPKFVRHFVVREHPPRTLPISKFPRYFTLLPNSLQPGFFVLISDSPLAAIPLPQTFFVAECPPLQPELTQASTIGERINYSLIEQLVDSTDGNTVAARRSDGGADVWASDATLGLSYQYSAESVQILMAFGKDRIAAFSLRDGEPTFTIHHPITSPIRATLPETLISLFYLPCHAPGLIRLLGITPRFSLVHINIHGEDNETITIHEHQPLISPSLSPVRCIESVDVNPAAVHATKEDAVLTISEAGELAFWDIDDSEEQCQWTCARVIRTERKNVRLARCGLGRKSALVAPTGNGDELTIWDWRESEFASGLELHINYESSDSICAIDWTRPPETPRRTFHSVLAVAFSNRIEVISPQHVSYFDETSGGVAWSTCWKLDFQRLCSHPITNVVWLPEARLLVSVGHQMLLYGDPPSLQEGLIRYVARRNGPLDEFDPQLILQCLLWGKIELVKTVIVNLARAFGLTKDHLPWTAVPAEEYLKDANPSKLDGSAPKRQVGSLFERLHDTDETNEDVFSRTLVDRVVDRLDSHNIPQMTPNEQAQLSVLIQTTLEVDEQRRSLDTNGLRYVTSMRTFYILNHRATSAAGSVDSGAGGGIPRKTGWRERLRYRDMVWAFHSESQGLLLDVSTTACSGKMCWSDARSLGIFLWLTSAETVKSQVETIARNEYTVSERDPSACSLFYFALGKVKLVHGLWRQAAGQKEQALMLKFLGNDFSQPRWKTAALKNAYALLSKRRHEYAAAFFLLGGSLKDAVNVCIKYLADFQLAIAIARVVEQGDDGPVLRDIIEGTVVPTAMREGNRWLASWAFWMVNRRDLAVRVLLTPLVDIAAVFGCPLDSIAEEHYDDPSLALLFSQLKFKTLQTARGMSHISTRDEFNFVLQMARVLCSMGCHVLALNLVKTWTFDRPTSVVREPLLTEPIEEPSTPLSPIRPSPLPPAHRRRSSIMIDMDIRSDPPTRAASPKRKRLDGVPEDSLAEEEDSSARQKGIGKLFSSAKQDTVVPEFNMDSFF